MKYLPPSAKSIGYDRQMESGLAETMGERRGANAKAAKRKFDDIVKKDSAEIHCKASRFLHG